ncbi:MAG: hypothetical protein KKH08_01565 [Candidatus Omnitrophica bacterium]|nr:hypothetical protein [Candidatus Omnitrophota bacterium]
MIKRNLAEKNKKLIYSSPEINEHGINEITKNCNFEMFGLPYPIQTTEGGLICNLQ